MGAEQGDLSPVPFRMQKATGTEYQTMLLFSNLKNIFPAMGDELLSTLLEHGKVIDVSSIELDASMIRMLERWELNGFEYVTEFDIRYDDVTEISSKGYIRDVRRANAGPRHICRVVDLCMRDSYTPAERWIESKEK